MGKEKNCKCHDKDCDCGCHHEQEEGGVVVLKTDDGRDIKFRYIHQIEKDGKKYAAFEPLEEVKGLEEVGVVIFEITEKDKDNFELLAIEDEALLDDLFNQLCNELEGEELSEEAESLECDCDDDCCDENCHCHHEK